MEKQYSSQKRSFIFIETLFSLLVLSLIVSSFYTLSYNKSSNQTFQQLQSVHNNFLQKQYSSNFSTSHKEIKVIRNSLFEERISLKEIAYFDGKMRLIQYEM